MLLAILLLFILPVFRTQVDRPYDTKILEYLVLEYSLCFYNHALVVLVVLIALVELVVIVFCTIYVTSKTPTKTVLALSSSFVTLCRNRVFVNGYCGD